jgi:hypothetical protein
MSKSELNLDVDSPDKVAGVLTAVATAYQESAVELSRRLARSPDPDDLGCNRH